MRLSPRLFALHLIAWCCIGVSCTPKQAAKTAIDIGQATCAELEGQPSTSEYVDVMCTVIDVASGVSKVFLARVRRPTAEMLAAKRCP